MAATSATYPGSVVNDTGVGAYAWTNPGNAVSDNNSYASCSIAGTGQSNYLWATSFGFAIPTGATIDGVTVEAGRYCDQSGASRYCKDAVMSLLKAGVVTGDNKADTSTKWPTSEGNKSYGGAVDGWNASLTYSDVNGSTFGCVLSCNITLVATAYVDYMRITINYTEAGGGPGMQTRIALLGVGR